MRPDIVSRTAPAPMAQPASPPKVDQRTPGTAAKR
jgi:hypothetical protein